jgi:hypothetical protein
MTSFNVRSLANVLNLSFNRDSPEETTPSPCMARSLACLLDKEQDGISVAVYPDFLDELYVAGSLALSPQFLPGAAPIAGPPFSKGRLQGFAVHVREHKDRTGLYVLSDDRHQAAGFIEIN